MLYVNRDETLVMNALAIRSLVVLLALLPLAAAADEDEVEEKMLSQVYDDGGTTLYCREAFQPDDRVKLDWIYSKKQMQQHFECITTRQCQRKPAFRNAFADLHNVYPVRRKAELDRRRTLFGDLPDGVKITSEECPYQLSFQTFNPPEYARGNVARAMLYMHMIHDLPLVGPLEMYQRWNRQDPPDDAERARNDAIEMIGGQRNVYIDSPEKADEIVAPSATRLQFGR